MVETEYKLVPSKENDCCEKKDESSPLTYGYGVRHVQGFLYFLCLALAYAARAHLGVSIVAMTMKTNNDNGTTVTEQMFSENNTILSNENYTDLRNNISILIEKSPSGSIWQIYRTYDWPKSTQEMILGAFFLGYCIMMLPFGIICQKFGGKIPLQVALIISAVTSFLTPWIVAWGDWKALCACRVIQGLSQAGMYPAITTLLSNWTPVSERGSLSSYVYTGSGVGTIAAFQIAGILAFSRFDWPSTFWVMGVLCFIGFVLITVYVSATPDAHRSISKEEKDFIIGDIGQRVSTKAKTPWKSILMSVPAWAAFIAHMGSAACFVFFFTQVPTYMFAILKVNIRNSGLLSSLPYISAFFSCTACGYFSDYFTNNKILSIRNARLISNSISSVFPAICLALVSYTTSTVLAVTCFVISLTAHAAMHTGWVVNYMDLSPNNSGALMACGNTLANILVLMLPVMVSNIVTDVNDQLQWRIMMFLMAGLSVTANTVFVFFMSTDVQPWNGDAEKKEIEAENVKVELQIEKAKN